MKEELVSKLINYFLSEFEEYKNIDIPASYNEKRKLLRGLINLRNPKYLDSKILDLEDRLLQIELKEKGIIDIASLCTKYLLDVFSKSIYYT